MRSFLVVLFFMSLIMSSHGQASDIVQVAIHVKSPGLADSTNVFVAGSIPSLGSWNPGKVMMEKSGHGWIKLVELPRGSTIEYKFTLGSWDTEGINEAGQVYSNFSLTVSGDTTLTHIIPSWKRSGGNAVIRSVVTGMARYHRQMQGDGISPRDIVVWLPPGYDARKKYPVLYMHDGQNIIDPGTSSFGVDWRIDESLDSLIRANAIPAMIVVGIYNTSDRSAEYTPGEMGTAYMRFVVKKLKPFIDQKYPTKQERSSTFVGGSSAGGLISFMLAWEYPQVFSAAICMSPAFKIMNIDYVKEVMMSDKKRKSFFYIDNGGVDLEARLQPGVDEMLSALKAKGYKEGTDYSYVADPAAKHFEAAWARRFPRAIMLVYQHKPSK